MSAFAKLNRGNDLDRIKKRIEETLNNGFENKDDDRFWQPTVDKAGNGMAIIRFLQAGEVDGGDDGDPFVKTFKHGFKGPGGWFIEECLTTIEQKCPVCEMNSKLWNSGVESDKKIVSGSGNEQPGTKRKLHYISNILVISDPANPENDGKLKLFRYGSKIFEKINEAMHPSFEDEVAFNPFNYWTGANFKLKIRKVDGYRNYDRSEFETPSELYGGDEKKLEALFKAQHSLKVFVDPDKFKSYDDQKARLNLVMGLGESKPKTPTRNDENASERRIEAPMGTQAKDSDNDSDMDYFRSLAEEDISY